MNTAQFADLRSRAQNLTELVRLEMSAPILVLDAIYDNVTKLMEVVETMRILEAAAGWKATADALAATGGRA